MDDLVAWYREQLDEDERVAREALDMPRPGGEWRWLWVHRMSTLSAACCIDPGRALREVDAKRQILDEYARLCEFGRLDGDGVRPSDPALYLAWTAFGKVVKLLAAAMDDRPGYRDEWRP